MSTRYTGARVTRNEDPALLCGRGLFVDDIHLPRLAHAAVLRSPHAHARIVRIDTRRARAARAVVAVLTHADLGDLGGPLPRLIPHPALVHHKTQQALASTTVRYVGEAAARRVAEGARAGAGAHRRRGAGGPPGAPRDPTEAGAGAGGAVGGRGRRVGEG